MPADAAAVRAALCEVRRRSWAARMAELARAAAGRVWVRAADARTAAATITDHEPSDAALLSALDAAVAKRLRGVGDDPGVALAAVVADLVDAGSPLSVEQHAVAGAGNRGGARAGRDGGRALCGGRRARGAAQATGGAGSGETRPHAPARRGAAPPRMGKEPGRGGGAAPAARLHRARGAQLGGGRSGPGGASPVHARARGRAPSIRPGGGRAVARRRRRLARCGGRATRGDHHHAPPPPQLPRGPAARGANAAVARAAALDRYAAHFATARALEPAHHPHHRPDQLRQEPCRARPAGGRRERHGAGAAPAARARVPGGARGARRPCLARHRGGAHPGAGQPASRRYGGDVPVPQSGGRGDGGRGADARRPRPWRRLDRRHHGCAGARGVRARGAGKRHLRPADRQALRRPAGGGGAAPQGAAGRRPRAGAVRRPSGRRCADRLLAAGGAGPPRRAAAARATRRRGLRRVESRGAAGRGGALPQRRGRDPGRHGRHRHGPQPADPPRGVLDACASSTARRGATFRRRR